MVAKTTVSGKVTPHSDLATVATLLTPLGSSIVLSENILVLADQCKKKREGEQIIAGVQNYVANG